MSVCGEELGGVGGEGGMLRMCECDTQEISIC